MKEIWKPIVGWNKYEISSYGRIRRDSTIRKLTTNNGYLYIHLSQDGKNKNFRVHRLVLLAHIGIPDQSQIHTRHIDGDKLNNHISNLRWGTVLENIEDKRQHHGFLTGFKLGEKHHNSKLLDQSIPKIFAMRKLGYLQKEIAKKFGVTQSNISRILNKETRTLKYKGATSRIEARMLRGTT
jgi:hypothetical protein